jgi:3-deoxy-7-phosphoheptulonate synthase
MLNRFEEWQDKFAKPSSSNFEDVNGVELPSYQGDNIHGDGSTLESKQPYLERMVWAYNQAIATLNFLHAFATKICH